MMSINNNNAYLEINETEFQRGSIKKMFSSVVNRRDSERFYQKDILKQ